MTTIKYRLIRQSIPSIVNFPKSKSAKDRAFQRKFSYSISRAVKNKPKSHEPKIYNAINHSLEVIHNGSVESLMGHIKKGNVITCVFNGTRKKAHFKETDIVFVDIDKGWNAADLCTCALVKEHAAFIYTTPSHTPESPELCSKRTRRLA